MVPEGSENPSLFSVGIGIPPYFWAGLGAGSALCPVTDCLCVTLGKNSFTESSLRRKQDKLVGARGRHQSEDVSPNSSPMVIQSNTHLGYCCVGTLKMHYGCQSAGSKAR